MIIDFLLNSPMVALVWIVVILLSLTVHEFSHAYMAFKKGDATAERAGRMTLNPLAHIDPLGFVALLLLGFGWAKPVPFNPYNLKNPQRDALHIAMAGPASNFLVAVFGGLAFRGLELAGLLVADSLLPTFLIFLILVNLFLMIFNLVPIYPLDGSAILDATLTKPHQQHLRQQIAAYGPKVLMALVILAILTNFNVFFFVSEPAYFICNVLTGGAC
ncbi:MAG: site-2 protease family protein [Patescibacteria group bacterium]|nr:site-2 protease family protein [Patescibacteria group bacterium]